MWTFRGKELSLMPSLVAPGPREIVCHNIDQIQISLGGTQVNVSKSPFSSGKRGGQDVSRGGKVFPQARQEVHVISSLLRVGGMLPVNYARDNSLVI